MIDIEDEVTRTLDRIKLPLPMRTGTLVKVTGMTLHARGLMAPIGTLCEVESTLGTPIQAEIVGFNDDILFLIPFSEPHGVAPGATIRVISLNTNVRVGKELMGRVIDGSGLPLDGRPAPKLLHNTPLHGEMLNPLNRGEIHEVLDVGVKAINAFLTIGRGQRVGLIAGSGVGKSVLLSMLTRYTAADVVVIGLIGERGREVAEFIKTTLGQDGLAKSVVVAAPANVSPVLRIRATHTAHAIAEYYRSLGLHVLLLVDSLTRVAHAQREVGLAIGEPPTSKGYPPSVFTLIPNLLERGGVGELGKGSITAMYTVLAEGDDAQDPIVDIARASLDGQVMLSRSLADAAHYPAIDLNGSISRVMQNIVEPQKWRKANRFRRLWSLYQQNAELIQVGAYQAGSNSEMDEAIRSNESLRAFLRQDMLENFNIQQTNSALDQLG